MMTQSNLNFTAGHEIPEGYKKTEVGLIPEDWNVVPLMHISEKIMVGIASSATHAYRNKGIPLLRNQNIKSNKLDDDDIIYISEDYEKGFLNKRLKEGDLLTARTGYPGTTCLVPKFFENAQSFTTLITRLKINSENPIYLSYFINSEKGQKFFTDNQIGGGQKNVNAATLKRFPVIVPPLNEQQKISTALSDTDALISELEKLIEKKQAIKTATMQQLLTGKTRLPEFALREDGTPKAYKESELGQIPEDWIVTRISNTLTIKHGKSQKLVESNDGKFPILATGGQIGWAKQYLYNKPSVLIGRKGTINKPRFIDQPFWSVDTLFYSEINDKYSARFLFYKFCRIDWNNYNEASGVPSLNAKTIENVLISVCSLEEQKEIVKILNELDNEISGLKDKRKKLLHIKNGMMQELLTGKTRLV